MSYQECRVRKAEIQPWWRLPPSTISAADNTDKQRLCVDLDALLKRPLNAPLRGWRCWTRILRSFCKRAAKCGAKT